MKPDVHPDYHPVVFQDAITGAAFLTRSTVTSSRTIEWQTPDGIRSYPLVVVEVSADSSLADRSTTVGRRRRPGREVPPAVRPARHPD